MDDRIVQVTIKDLRLKTFIGFNESEKTEKQDVVITVSYKYNAAGAIETDDINHAFNYKTITKRIISFVEESRFNLLETLTSRIFQLVAQNSGLSDIEVSVEKPGALRFCDNVIARISSEYGKK